MCYNVCVYCNQYFPIISSMLILRNKTTYYDQTGNVNTNNIWIKAEVYLHADVDALSLGGLTGLSVYR